VAAGVEPLASGAVKIALPAVPGPQHAQAHAATGIDIGTPYQGQYDSSVL
jgi:hypothetical protein